MSGPLVPLSASGRRRLLSRELANMVNSVASTVNVFCGVLADMGNDRVVAGVDLSGDAVVTEAVEELVSLCVVQQTCDACPFGDADDPPLQQAYRDAHNALSHVASDLLKSAEISNLHAGKLAHAVSSLKSWVESAERTFSTASTSEAPPGTASPPAEGTAGAPAAPGAVEAAA